MYEFENVAAVGWWTTGQMAPFATAKQYSNI